MDQPPNGWSPEISSFGREVREEGSAFPKVEK
jgi:hypothetical protein